MTTSARSTNGPKTPAVLSPTLEAVDKPTAFWARLSTASTALLTDEIATVEAAV